MIPGVSASVEQGLSATGIAGAIIYAIYRARRTHSRDGAEIVKDRAESDLVQNLSKERTQAVQDARTAWETANGLIGENARLKAENEHKDSEIARLKAIVAEMQVKLDEVMKTLNGLTKAASNAIPRE